MTTPPTYTEANQCFISDQWITIDVLEEGYGHGFGLRGLRDESPKPSHRHAEVVGWGSERQKSFSPQIVHDHPE